MNCSTVFNAYSRYYDLLYLDKDYIGEVAYVQNLLVRYGITKGSLLEFGSGTGKHGCLLATNGYTVHGIELNASMVSEAQIVHGFSCEQGDITTVKMCRTYDAVLSIFHVISYQTTNMQLHAMFSNAAEHLSTNGLFIFDFWYSPAVYAQKPSVRVKRMADHDVEITRIAEPKIYANKNCVDVTYTFFVHNISSGSIQSFQEIHPMRHFSLPEINLMANIHGFELLQAEQFLLGAQPSEDTWGVCVVLGKN